ncbi:MAG: hypothetical protein WAO52_13135, partial [Prolixibacteraceae bacterium]
PTKTDKKDERQILLQLIKNGNPAKNILGRKISVNHRLYGQTLTRLKNISFKYSTLYQDE